MSLADLVAYDAKRTELYSQRNGGKSMHLCRCKKCSEKCEHVPVYERTLYYTRQQCARHMLKERGAAKEGDPPSFYAPEVVLTLMQADLRIPEEAVAAIRRGVSTQDLIAVLQTEKVLSPSTT